MGKMPNASSTAPPPSTCYFASKDEIFYALAEEGFPMMRSRRGTAAVASTTRSCPAIDVLVDTSLRRTSRSTSSLMFVDRLGARDHRP